MRLTRKDRYDLIFALIFFPIFVYGLMHLSKLYGKFAIALSFILVLVYEYLTWKNRELKREELEPIYDRMIAREKNKERKKLLKEASEHMLKG